MSRWLSWAFVAWFLLIPSEARAFLFEEHADITREALKPADAEHPDYLSKTELEILQKAWARLHHSLGNDWQALCKDLDHHQVGQRTEFKHCVDLGMLAALAADHSCSAEDLRTTLKAAWLRGVVESAAISQRELRQAESRAAHIDAWNRSHLLLQETDARYLGRAAKNEAHFLIPRVSAQETLNEYVQRMSAKGQALNAVGLFSAYHATALDRARLEDPKGNVMLLEAMALHFLEDGFSAGHVIGSPRRNEFRKGTHDHYCEAGVTTSSWNGSTMTLRGDSFLEAEHRLQAAQAVRATLRSLAKVLASGAGLGGQPETIDQMNICEDIHMPGVALTNAELDVLRSTPAPSVKGYGVPEMRAEFGGYASMSAGLAPYLVLPFGYEPDIEDRSNVARAGFMGTFSVGLGYAVEGISTGATDPQIYIRGTLVTKARERNFGSEEVGIGRRFGGGFNVRAPFIYVPGDGIVVGLVTGVAALLGEDPSVPEDLLRYGADGGVWPWFRVLRLKNTATLQIMLGRELGVYWMEAAKAEAVYATQSLETVAGPIIKVVPSEDVTAVDFDVPWLELRLRPEAVSGDLTGGASVKFGTLSSRYSYPGEHGSSWAHAVLLKFELEGRRYF
ncbi:MAG: hypothetical protein AB7K71_07695 [Polyangiaceae bacterium]